RGGDAHPEGGGPRGGDAHAAPGEGQREAAGLWALPAAAQGEIDAGVKGGIEEGGVNAEAGRFSRMLFGQGDLGVDLLAVSPGCAQAPEGGAVFEAVLRQAVIEVVDLERLSSLGGPSIERLRRGYRQIGEDAGGVARPLRSLGKLPVPAALRAGVDRGLAPTLTTWARDRDLDRHRSRLGEDQRCLQGELLDGGGINLLGCSQRQLDEGGAGQKDGAGYHVVGQPGMGGEGEAAGEQQALARVTCQLDSGSQ